ncbi:magnesium and cobalt efflux protein CorC [Lachnospiraceae bacterium KM106-2]|nr:magnesium and cobalt efflux protein CorC [Lachnospiraceae bacterium KM106-2]
MIILLLLLLLSAFFSSAETALTTVNKLRMRSLAEEGNKKAKTVCKLIEDPSKMLGAILIGNNIVNLTASSITTTFATNLAHSNGLGLDASIVIGIATGVLTFLILLFGEITPKNLATMYAENLSLKYGNVIYFLTQLLTPIIFLINKISNGFQIILGFDPNKKTSAITENELRTIVEVSHEEGVIESEERRMITNVVDFGDSLTKDVMIPRVDVEFASIDLTYDELVEAFSQEKYSRLPVYSENTDDIVGIINLKDIFFYDGDREKFSIESIMREPYFTYEFKHTSELLIEMRRESISMAVVLDEYGATVGIITMEDLLEEIVGEIRDEYDEDEQDPIQPVSDNEFLVDGNTKLDDINEILGTDIESEDYDSIAGHIICLLDHLPDNGETVTDGPLTMTVEAVDKNRIDKIRIKIDPDYEEEIDTDE